MNTLVSWINPMQGVINAYRISDSAKKEKTLQQLIENRATRTAVSEWIRKHPECIAHSPMMADLKDRVQRVTVSLPAPSLASTLIERALYYVRAGIGSFLGSFDRAEVERKLLAGKFDELSDRFRAHPDALYKFVKLFETHLKLKTCTMNQLLPVISSAASTLAEHDYPWAYNPFASLGQRPSLYRIFNTEIEKLRNLGALAPYMEALVAQDTISSNPYLSEKNIVLI